LQEAGIGKIRPRTIAARRCDRHRPGPVPCWRAGGIDAPWGEIEGMAAALVEVEKAVSALLLALDPAVGGKPRHGSPERAGLDAKPRHNVLQGRKRDSTAMRNDGVAEDGDDQRPNPQPVALMQAA